MRHQEIFDRHVLIARVALQQELNERQWQPPIRDIEACPFCKSEDISKLLKHRNGNTYLCRSCDSKFSAEDIPGCACWVPGNLDKCQKCVHYRSIQKGVKARIEGDLKDMTVEEAETLLSPGSSLYMNRRKLPPKPTKHTPPTKQKTTNQQTGQQLDLF